MTASSTTPGLIRSVIVGTGSALPQQCVTNAELTTRVDTTDAWIVERTGIRMRHIAGEGETTATMGADAAMRAIEAAGITPQDIGLIILATATPDNSFPASATKIQAILDIDRCIAFDIAAVCSGFVYALSVADAMLRTGAATYALVIGSETFSRLLDWEDRTTCVLFGDGAGAVVLRADPGTGTTDDRGILATQLYAEGRYGDLLYVDGGPATTGTVGHVRMKGQDVFRHAVANLASVLQQILNDNGVAPSAIDWVVPHQANRRIIDATVRKLGLAPNRVVVTVDNHANTSAASVPLALDCAVRDGRIKPGHLVVLEAMGGGLTWGAALVRM